MIGRNLVRAELVDARLADLGLSVEVLRSAVLAGHEARDNFTKLHPRMLPGVAAWGETIFSLRDQLIPLGWEMSQKSGIELVRNAEQNFEVAVLAGNSKTGSDFTPLSRLPKGPATQAIIRNNGGFLPKPEQLLLDGLESGDVQELDLPVWFLLVYEGQNEIRSELSFPIALNQNNLVCDYRTRIPLPVIDISVDMIIQPERSEIDIDVRKRA